jgi:hypothetical protein
MANYDSKPSMYEANGDGSFTYRWNIREVLSQVTGENGEQEQKKSWECNETVVWATVTREKLVSAVLSSVWDKDYEAKLVNDYNAAKAGVFGEETGDEAQKYINRYVAFLGERKALKEMVNVDCEALQIV